MTDADRVHAALERLPIFPMPGGVLLPHTTIPLHIFEPRYRKMTRDCQAGARVLALANVLEPGGPRGQQAAKGEPPPPEGAPRVSQIIGVGLLARVEPMTDGRFNIMVRGVLRARIVEELHSGEPYRLVRAELLTEVLPEAPFDDAQAGRSILDQAEALRRLVLALCAARPSDESNQLAQLAVRAKDPGELADIVAGSLLENPNEKQAALEAVRIARRLDLATQTVAGLLAQSASTDSRPN